MVPTLASMQCACALTQRCATPTANGAIGPNTALRLCGAVRLVVAAPRTNHRRTVGRKASDMHEWRSTSRSAKQPRHLNSRVFRPCNEESQSDHTRREEYEGVRQRVTVTLQTACFSQELAPHEAQTEVCAAIKPPKAPSEEELRARLSLRNGEKTVERAAARVAAAI